MPARCDVAAEWGGEDPILAGRIKGFEQRKQKGKIGNTAKVAMSCSAVEVLSTVAPTSQVASEIAWQNVYEV